MDAKTLCPLIGGECIKDGAIRDGSLVKCKFWVTVMGTHPQTGESVNSGDCCMSWLPILLIENSKVNRETGAAVESMRNESVTASQHIERAILSAAAGRKLLPTGG